MRVSDIYHAEPGLPADLASFQLEGQLEAPVLLLSAQSFPPGALASARLLGAASLTSTGAQEQRYPLDDWVFVAAAEVDSSLALYQSLEMLPPAHLAALRVYVRERTKQERQQSTAEIEVYSAEMAARCIRETASSLEAGTTQPAKGERTGSNGRRKSDPLPGVL